MAMRAEYRRGHGGDFSDGITAEYVGTIIALAIVASPFVGAAYGAYKVGEAAVTEKYGDPMRVPDEAVVYQNADKGTKAWTVPIAAAGSIDCGNRTRGFGLIHFENDKRVKNFPGNTALKLVACKVDSDQPIEKFTFRPAAAS